MATIKLFNFLTRKKEIFRPIHKKWAGLYTCGPTVYNYAHIGNLRTYIFEDVLRRALEYAGYKVKHVMNITDIDDKIIKGAAKAKKNIADFAAPYEAAFFTDLKKLNILPAQKYPKATRHIPEMIRIVKILLAKKIAYAAKDGIYFDISKYKSYGKLTRPPRSSEENFVLWKAAKKGEPFWRSPFGAGRPGWHLECSAMSMKYLGSSFDIHAGGVDLLFPHHENEIAQSESATKKKFAEYFIEGEHLLVDGKKMAKSLGNFLILKSLELRGFSPLAFRYLALSAHYRSQLNFTWESLGAAENSLERLYDFTRMLCSNQSFSSRLTLPRNSGGSDAARKMISFRKNFQKALFDDLNTPKALALMWSLVHEYNISPKKYDSKSVLELFYDFDEVLGLGLRDLKEEKAPEEALKLLKEREKARQSENFKKADELREKIKKLGWQIKDTESGSQLFHF